MNYPQFESKWIGKRVDYDGVAAYQCVDLAKQYLDECYGIQPKSWGDAIAYWYETKAPILEKFTKVTGSSARQGDIAVFNGTTANPYGHIGIATGTINDTQLEILEQNGGRGSGTGTGTDAIRKNYVARNRVAGLLRPKEVNVIPDTDNYYWRYGQNLAMKLRGRELSREEFRTHIVGKTDLQAIEILSDDPEAAIVQHWQDVGKVAVTDNWQQQIYDLQAATKTQSARIAELEKATTPPDVAELNKLTESLKWVTNRK